MGNKKSNKSANRSNSPISECKERGKPGRTLILKLIQSEAFFKRPRHQKITPNQLGTFEDKYLKRCLELIHASSLQDAPYPPVSMNLSSVDTTFISDNKLFGNKYPSAVDYQIMAVGDEAIMEGNSMVNLLSSPVFQKLGVISDHNARQSGTNVFSNKRCIPSDYQASPARLIPSPVKETGFKSYSVPKDMISDSHSGLDSSLSTDPKSSGCSTSQGLLECTWENDVPSFTFSLDGENEVYLANVTKSEDFEYIYSFNLKGNGIESELIGKMTVSTLFSLCEGNNSEVKEMEFVLFGTIDNHVTEIHPLNRNNRRNYSRKLSRVIDMFKPSPSHKHLDRASRPEHPENDFVPNLELAAIVVKCLVKEVGGWGLNFLKMSKTIECCRCDVGDCSTSTDIIVPSGFHGGPRGRNDGPSSLIERWRCGGECNCGGWDLGCPLKVFKGLPRRETGGNHSDSLGECKSFNMFIEGSEEGTPKMKMVKVQDDCYFVSFESRSLSTLQCFAIGVATIHSKTPSLSQNKCASAVVSSTFPTIAEVLR